MFLMLAVPMNSIHKPNKRRLLAGQNRRKEISTFPEMKIYVAIFLNCLTIITPPLL